MKTFVDIHYIYGFCNGNARATIHKYAARFPDRQQPRCSVFVYIYIIFISALAKKGLGLQKKYLIHSSIHTS